VNGVCGLSIEIKDSYYGKGSIPGGEEKPCVQFDAGGKDLGDKSVSGFKKIPR